jgi:chromosome segregation ATPase
VNNEHAIYIRQLVEQHSATVNAMQAEKVELTTLVNKLQSEKAELHCDITQASNYMMTLEDKVYSANKTSLELMKQLKADEEEITGLKSYILELKARVAIYVPNQDDPVDVKIADYINNYPDRTKLKIMFMRESTGVYAFGTKRINVEV